ncbi:MAG: DUF308 domain-containing protein [Burkholderiales bacterium]|jgi:uncharacterized membrane protein HdeD (DUF308 family)
MSDDSQSIRSEFFGEIKKHAGLTILMGVIVLIMGFLAIGSPLLAGLSVALAVGILLLIGGIGQLVFAIKGKTGAVSVIVGLLTVLVGGYMVVNVDVALVSLTLFLAAYFIVSGIFEAMLSFQAKPAAGWGWALFSGIVSLLLGIMIWSQYPVSGVWAIGILFGVRMIFAGWTLIMIGSAARSASEEFARA